MARLTKTQWEEARAKWELDPREGFDWLVAELKLDVSRQAVSKAAKAQGWGKGEAAKQSIEKVAQPKKKSCATKSKVAQPNQQPKIKVKSIAVAAQADTETPGDDSGRLHGNSLYKPEYAEQAYNYCLLGATDEKLAAFFKVDVRTIDNWKLVHDDFLQALREGKEIANMEIAKSLFNRAKGYVHTETKAALHEGAFVTIDLEKHYPPDTGAIKVWLYNRDPENWKDKIEVSSSIKLDKELLDQIESQFITKMQAAHERQRAILIERGITIDQE